MNERVIHTRLYSNIAKEVLQSVNDQMSDGIWENSTAAEKYWRFSKVVVEPDGEVVIEIKSEPGKFNYNNTKWMKNAFANMTAIDIIEWFAAKVKHIMQIELKDDNIQNGWKRDNTSYETSYLSSAEKITVRDVYFIYDFLMGRDVKTKYEDNVGLNIVSAPKSDEETTKENTRRANLAKLEAEWKNARNALEEEKKAAIKKLEEEFNNKITILNAEMFEKRKALKG